MQTLKLALIALATTVFFIALPATAQTLYEDPVKIQSYVSDPVKIIKQGMERYGWTTEQESPGEIIAILDYKTYLVKVAIHYNTETITVDSISEARVNCVVTKREKCKFDADTIVLWRINLRRGITKAMHDLAIADAYTKLAQ